MTLNTAPTLVARNVTDAISTGPLAVALLR
jgi:hypothetical protein